jgi:hypothetical protein
VSNAYKAGVSTWPRGVDGDLIAASMAAASWHRHSTSINCFRKFCVTKGIKLNWPIESETVRSFTSWALRSKNLSASSTKVYISDLKLAHKLRNIACRFENDIFIPLMIKGAKNLALYKQICKPAKFVLSFQLLKLVGHEIAKSNWPKDNKLVFWAACCVAFFGSFRLGEILPAEESVSNPENLKWNQVSFTRKNSAIINIRFPKVIRNTKGDFVDLFEIKNCSCCPYTALKKLAEIHQHLVKKNHEVFSFANGEFLTQKLLTETIKKLLKKHIGDSANQITGHSFRAGIPAALAEHPDLASDHEIMIWGRWSSNSYQAYTRLKHEAKSSIFKKIVSMYEL